MNESRPSFGELLRQLRSAASLSQEGLAETAGLSRRGISDLERGLRQAPRLETVRLLVEALNLSDADRSALLTAARPALRRDGPASLSPFAHTSLPMPLTRLIGRETELMVLQAALRDEDVRLHTLTGPGGVGKTRLALAAATRIQDQFTDGAVFVPLAAVADPALVLPAIARVLDIRETLGRPLAEALIVALRDRHLLLVLDNFEHVLPAAADLATLLTACPRLTVLVTSRAPLRLSGERRLLTPPLTLPAPSASPVIDTLADYAAIALFIERARSVQHEFTLDPGNADAVVAICRRLDGLPLAIELAAAWVHMLPPAALLERLEPRLPLLHGGAEDQPVRLRTMRDAIAWSYDLLDEEEARLFRRLAIFVGGFTLEGVAWVSQEGDREIGTSDDRGTNDPSPHHPITPSPSVLDLLAGLIDKSLLQPMHANGSEPRFTMLETVREFALEKLAASGEAESIATLQGTWSVRLAEGVRRAGGLSQGRALAILEAEHPNVRAALTWFLERGEVTSALHLAGELAEFWLRHGHWTEGAAWLERALTADAGAPTAARANALVGLNMLLWGRDELPRAARLLREAETVACAAGDAGALAYARLHQGYVAAFQGDLDLALARGDEALAACEAIPQGFSCNGARWLLARVALARGEDERATELYEHLLAAARVEGDESSVVNGLHGLATVAERRGHIAQALAGFAEAAAVSQGYGELQVSSHCLDAAAATAVSLGQPDTAVRLFAAAEALRRSVGAAPLLGAQVDRSRHLQALDAAGATLGAKRFAATWAAGSALMLDEAIAEATSLAHLAIFPRHPATSAAKRRDEGVRSRAR